jgi:hypothetical protein
VLVALPAGNAGEVPPALASELAALGIETVALARVQPLFDALAMPLPESPGKTPGNRAGTVSVAASAANPPAARGAAAPRRRWIVGAVAASALLAIAATGAVLLKPRGGSSYPARPELAEAPTAPAVQPSLPATAQPAPAPVRVALDPDHVPFVTAQERARIRDEYMKAPGYKALATSLWHMAFVASQASQEDADRAALKACEGLPLAGSRAESACDLYASGDVVVTRRGAPPMPAEPWLVRNPAIERPFTAAELPFLSASAKESGGKRYASASRSKAFVLSPARRWNFSADQASADDAVRRTLERCGYTSGVACMVVAVDDTFVVPTPTLAKPVGIYRPEAMPGVKPETRDEIARRLAGAPNSWNAVAVGAGGNVGIAVRADSEQSAFDGAMKDCAAHDSNCRIAVLGPFLVEPTDQGPNQVQAQNQAPTQNAEPHAAPSPQPAPPPAAPPAAVQAPKRAPVPYQFAEQNAPPAPAGPAAATPDQNQAPPQKQEPIPRETAEQNALPPLPAPAPAAPPAATPDQNRIQPPKQNPPPAQTARQNAPPPPHPASAPPAVQPQVQAQKSGGMQSLTEERNASAAPRLATAPTPASPTPATPRPATPTPATPTPAPSSHVALVPDRVPYVTNHDRARIRDEYMRASDYKALATNLLTIAFVTGQPSQEAADRAAMEACKNLAHGALRRNAADGRERACDLYASGNVVVTRRSPPSMPAQPWLVRNPAIEQPFVATSTPLADRKDLLGERYARAPGPKALAIARTGLSSFSGAASDHDEAMRRSLERCGFLTSTPCMVVALDDTFVVPIPALAKVVGLYRPEALSTLRPQARDDVARRLAGAPNGWNAVAAGTNGNIGTAIGARSEQSAFDGALADCARHDRDCRVLVLGPFLVEMIDGGRGQPRPQAPAQPVVQAQKQNQSLTGAHNASAPPRLASASGPTAAAPTGTALVPDLVPYIKPQDRTRIRDEYMRARDYKALAMNLSMIAFVSGQRSQAAADRAAMEACKNLTHDSTARERVCDLYASGNIVVTRRGPPPMPAQPWIIRNPAVEQPFVADLIPLVRVKERIANGYRKPGPRALAIAPTGSWSFVHDPSHDEAMRRSLQHCGFMASAACLVVAIDDRFVVPIPTLVKVIGVYRPESLVAVQPQARDEVARRLAGAPNGWNAVAVGAGGNVGIAIGAQSERSALDDAFVDCARHDRDCRILVLGPFLVELAQQTPGQAQRPAQALPPQAPSREYRATSRSEYRK